MGGKPVKAAASSPGETPRDGPRTLKELEIEATRQLMEEIYKWKELAAKEDAEGPDMTPLDNSMYGYAYERLELPKDKEGYVQTFPVRGEEEAARAFFDKFGVVCFHHAISEEDAKVSEVECWEFIERQLPGVRRDDVRTWGEYWPSLAANLGILGNAICLAPSFCRNRENPEVHHCFSTIFGTEQLWVNVGRASAHRPTRDVPAGEDGALVDKPEWKTRSEWLHWDSNPWTGYCSTFSFRVADNSCNSYEHGQTVVQGILALKDCGPADGGFHMVPGFHNHIRGWANANLSQEHFPPKLRDTTLSIQVPLRDPIREDVQTCPLRKGTLLIWNSYIPHGAFPNDSSNGRMVQYIRCYPCSNISIKPLFDDPSLLPAGYEPSPLGRKLLGLDAWEGRE